MEKTNFLKPVNGWCIVLLLLLGMVHCNRSAQPLEKGEAHLLLGDFGRAERCFASVVDRSPRSHRARIGLAKALLQRHSVFNGDTTLLPRALVQLEAARTLYPDTAVEKILSIVWFARAKDVLKRSEDTAEALAALSRSIALDQSSHRSLNLAGILYFYRGDQTKALTLFSLATKKDSLSATGYFNRGMVFWANSNYTRAYQDWFKAAQCSPDDSEIVLWAARAKDRMNGGSQ